jgi:hypothetical protein
MYEIDAVNIENIVRTAVGNERRTTYGDIPIPENLLYDADYILLQDADFRSSKTTPSHNESFLNEVKQLPEKIIQKLNSIYMNMYKPLLNPYY